MRVLQNVTPNPQVLFLFLKLLVSSTSYTAVILYYRLNSCSEIFNNASRDSKGETACFQKGSLVQRIARNTEVLYTSLVAVKINVLGTKDGLNSKGKARTEEDCKLGR